MANQPQKVVSAVQKQLGLHHLGPDYVLLRSLLHQGFYCTRV